MAKVFYHQEQPQWRQIRSEGVSKSESSGIPLLFTLPPVSGKFIQKIQRGEYMDIAGLQRDNMELAHRRSTHEATATNLGLGIQLSHQEVPDLISWVQSFGVYAAVVSVP